MPGSVSRQLTILGETSRLLDEAKSMNDIKIVRDKAEAARVFVKAARLGLELQNRAAELKLRAERKAGKQLTALHLRGGDRRSNHQRPILTLKEIGISRDQSQRWQRLAAVPNREFARYLRDSIENGREISSAGLLRIAMKSQTNRRRRPVCMSPRDIGEPVIHDEILIELTNHFRQLANVLSPIYEERVIDLRTVERRFIGRLVREMGELIVQLTTACTSSNSKTGHRNL